MLVLSVAAGAVGVYFAGVRPVMRFRSAEGWLTPRCEVVSSGVKTQHDGNLTKYYIDVVYRYEVGGQTFTSSDFDLFSGSSSGCGDDRELAKRFPVGTTAECYVNPRDPRDAVLNRRLPPETGWVIAPLMMMAMGGLPFVLHWRRRGSEHAGVAVERSAPVPVRVQAPGLSAPLTPYESRRAKWVALVIVMALSAGVWWVLSRGVLDLAAEIAGPTGASHFVLTALRVGFGLLLAWLPLRIALDIRSPYLALSLSPAVARFGAPARIEWRLLGRKARVTSLRMWLEGKAGGEGQRPMKSDEDLFHRHLLLDVSGEAVTAAGQVQMSVPDPQQSWPPANRAHWTIRVELHAPPLPKVVSGYKIELAG